MHVFSKRGGKGTRCGAYDEAGLGGLQQKKFINKNIQPPANPIFCQWVDRVDRVQSIKSIDFKDTPMMAVLNADLNRRGRGTCPITGGFDAKWHRRINGYDPGPSEPSDSPLNGVTILRLNKEAIIPILDDCVLTDILCFEIDGRYFELTIAAIEDALDCLGELCDMLIDLHYPLQSSMNIYKSSCSCLKMNRQKADVFTCIIDVNIPCSGLQTDLTERSTL
ncbi:hypothetical protein M5K25_020759 [Dendrobium thyrsiflorum]|uniref:Uncharacterized protein n=1 Tax=Dendrobium thyrsiflorum TaxID=117978 RepID=A0ABD0UI37_DENTH